MQLTNLTNRKGSRSFQRGCCISLRSPADCLFLYKGWWKMSVHVAIRLYQDIIDMVAVFREARDAEKQEKEWLLDLGIKNEEEKANRPQNDGIGVITWYDLDVE